MPEPQETATERLADIIHGVLLAYQTGTLHAERGGGMSREEGEILFANGQVIDAHAGELTGIEALNWLRSWGQCRFHFTHQPVSEIISEGTTSQRPASLAERLTGMVKNINQRYLGQGTSNTPDSGSVRHGAPDTGQQQQLGPDTSSHYLNGPTTGPHRWGGRDTGAQRRATGPQSGVGWSYHTDTIPPSRSSETGPNTRHQSGPKPPKRLIEGNAAVARLEQLRLSRLHRHVFLLLDGQRTVHDLAWLTKHPSEEVQQLLNDLEQAGMIRQ